MWKETPPRRHGLRRRRGRHPWWSRRRRRFCRAQRLLWYRKWSLLGCSHTQASVAQPGSRLFSAGGTALTGSPRVRAGRPTRNGHGAGKGDLEQGTVAVPTVCVPDQRASSIWHAAGCPTVCTQAVLWLCAWADSWQHAMEFHSRRMASCILNLSHGVLHPESVLFLLKSEKLL